MLAKLYCKIFIFSTTFSEVGLLGVNGEQIFIDSEKVGNLRRLSEWCFMVSRILIYSCKSVFFCNVNNWVSTYDNGNNNVEFSLC